HGRKAGENEEPLRDHTAGSKRGAIKAECGKKARAHRDRRGARGRENARHELLPERRLGDPDLGEMIQRYGPSPPWRTAAVPGQPPVRIKTASNVPNERPVSSIVIVSSRGRTAGMATCLTRPVHEAPLRVASSHRSVGIEARLGSSRNVTNGAIRQTSTAITARSARRRSPRGDGRSGRPSQPRTK